MLQCHGIILLLGLRLKLSQSLPLQLYPMDRNNITEATEYFSTNSTDGIKNIEATDQVIWNTQNELSPETPLSEYLLQGVFLSQLENSVRLSDLTQAFTAAAQDDESKDNVTQHLLRDVEVLQQQVLQQEADAQLLRDQLLLKKDTLEEQEETLKQLHGTIQQQEAALLENKNSLSQTKEEKLILQTQLEKQAGEKLVLEEELRRVKEELRLAKDVAAKLREVEESQASHVLQVQSLTQRHQEVTNSLQESLMACQLSLQEATMSRHHHTPIWNKHRRHGGRG